MKKERPIIKKILKISIYLVLSILFCTFVLANNPTNDAINPTLFLFFIDDEQNNTLFIEMYGGPLTECSTCPDYTYNDLVDYYWPALVAGVEKYSGQNIIDYVGHSGGCRVALDSLKNWSAGKNNAGYYFDTTTGTYVLTDLASSPVDTFIGLGCPGALNGSSHVISKALENGDTALQFFQDNGQSHISGRDFAKRLNLDYAIFWPKNKISLNLVIFFKNISTSSEDSQPGTGLSINNLYLIAGKRSRSKPKTGNDGIVPLEDIYSINSSVSYNNGEVMIYNVYHDNLPDDESIQNYVKDKLIGRVS